MIKEYSLVVLQKAIHHALSLDPSMTARMPDLHGKTLELIISPLQVTVFISFRDGTVALLASFNGQADVVISSSPLGLIRLSLLPASKVRSLFNDKIRMSGDLELGQQVKKLFDELDIDWEGHLAQFTGDVVAHQIGSFVRHGLSFKQRISQSMQHNTSDYLHEELRLFPTREEVNDFCNDIDALNMHVERLTATINQLPAHHEPC